MLEAINSASAGFALQMMFRILLLNPESATTILFLFLLGNTLVETLPVPLEQS